MGKKTVGKKLGIKPFLKFAYLPLLLVAAGVMVFIRFYHQEAPAVAPTLPAPTSVSRWYQPTQVQLGRRVYQENCQVCHGFKGQATPNWRTPLANGAYPPPPLNGTAHTWHHPLSVLLQTVRNGGQNQGGMMPAFAEVLSEREQLAVIAYIQSLWSDEIYHTWQQRVEKSAP